MHLYSTLVLAIVAVIANSHEVRFKNNCGKAITVFTLENGPGKQKTSTQLNPNQETSRNYPRSWGGRYWARYSDVGPISGWPQPDSLAEIKFDGYLGMDFYDISLVDGFSVPLTFQLIPGTFQKNPADARSCKTIACQVDFIANCPEELKMRQGNRVVACESACTKFKREEYCCTGSHSTPQTCPQNKYGRIFKNACPDAYSYAYDDATSTFTCKSAPGKESGYTVKFC